MKAPLLFIYTALFLLQSLTAKETPIPAKSAAFLERYCLDCHDTDTEKGEVNLELTAINWNSPKNLTFWQRVLEVTKDGSMPPKKQKKQPSVDERHEVIAWLDSSLLRHSKIGGTLARRLSNDEYQNTIRQLFNLPKFNLPIGFPQDTELYGFNNVGAGLTLSGPLMETYASVAQKIANDIFPPVKPEIKVMKSTAGPEDMVLSFSASTIINGNQRLASKSIDIMRSCTWPTKMEVLTSGTYKVSVNTSTFKPQARGLHKGPMILEIKARNLDASDRAKINQFRLLKEIEVTSESPQKFTFEADLYEGQTLIFRWKNGMLDHVGEKLSAHAAMRFKKDKRFLAAWQSVVLKENGKLTDLRPLRGGNGWSKIKAAYKSKDLDLSHATMNSPRTRIILKGLKNAAHARNLHDCFTYDYFENGPSLELHSVSMEGPLKIVKGPKDKKRQAQQQRLMGTTRDGRTDEQLARLTLQNFLPRAFRGPVDEVTINTYLKIAQQHWAKGHSFEEGMHLLVRSILISPRFLYRCLEQGKMSDYDLATRLAYFLTQKPADGQLLALAKAGKLRNPKILKKEALRLMPRTYNAPMVTSFTDQWLGLNKLIDIMPAPEFRFNDSEIETAKREVYSFFNEMLRSNRILTDFIAPDFTYTTYNFAKRNYRFTPKVKLKTAKDKNRFRKIPIKRNHPNSGLLGQSAIMMATANGVDTQPVLRGVWVLENILGSPSPPPPKEIPALTPDTQGSTTPREQLAKHTNSPSCARCHKKIDPVGFVFENFDPVGRWRTKWPKSGKKIDPTGELTDGTKIKDIRDFKKWLVSNIDHFSECLAEKLIIYATGRKPNYSEHQEIKTIVKANHKNGNRFQDLLLALIQSKTFRTK